MESLIKVGISTGQEALARGPPIMVGVACRGINTMGVLTAGQGTLSTDVQQKRMLHV